MAEGTLVAESLRPDADLQAIVLQVTRIRRVDAGDASVGQPAIWTMLEFEVDDDRADGLASALSGALEPTGGWYCDFRTGADTFVIFAGRVLRYPRGELAGRRRAEAHAREVGVPDAQLDWPE